MIQLYAKHEINKDCIGGTLYVPKGAICTTDNNLIYYKDKIVCLANSETAKNFCLNTKEAIEREELLERLIPIDPPPNNMDQYHRQDYWSLLGEFSPWGWQWNEFILHLPNFELKNILAKLYSKEVY